jgi:hypothetical protein
MTRTHLIVVVTAVALAAAAWIDPLYVPLVLLGPLLTGLVAGARGSGWRIPALTWVIAGVLVLVGDAVVNGEDVAFHAGVTVLTVALVGLGAAAGRLARRRPAAA